MDSHLLRVCGQIDIVEELDLGMSCVPDGEYVLAPTNYSRQQTTVCYFLCH